MDFQAHQSKAESKTAEFVLYFFLAVVGSACVLYMPILLLPIGQQNQLLQHYLLSPLTFLWCFVIALLIIGIASLRKLAQLRKGGGKLVASLCGASPLTSPSNHKERVLADIVEGYSREFQIKAPALYVIRDEPAINALVAGEGEADMILAVTQGTLDNLTRDELKGVAGHEFSHLLNGDIRLCTQLVAIVFGVSSLSMLGHYCSMLGGLGRFAGYILVFGGSFGRLCAQAMQASVSRQRELLADACAVRFTGDPPGPNPQWLYVANTDALVRFPYKSGDVEASAQPIEIASDIPGGGRLAGGGH